MPLEEIRLTPKNITQGLDILRDMKSLKTIGIDDNQAWPAAEFWERYDKGEFSSLAAATPFTDADVQRIAALPAEQQVEEVRKELMRRNPGFDGKMESQDRGRRRHGIQDRDRPGDGHRPDSGLQRPAGARLQWHVTPDWHGGNGLLADLTPLKGMNLADLTHLDLTGTKVSDAGLVYFKDCKNLTYLDLDSTQVSDAGLAHFKDCKNLTGL